MMDWMVVRVDTLDITLGKDNLKPSRKKIHVEEWIGVPMKQA